MPKEIQIMLLIMIALLAFVVVLQAITLTKKDSIIRLLNRNVKDAEGLQTICNNTYIKRCTELRDEYQEAINFTRESYTKEIQLLRFRIDNLMLEYCPDQMTVAQFANCTHHQKKVDPNFNLVLPDTPEEEKQIQDIEYKEEIKNGNS